MGPNDGPDSMGKATSPKSNVGKPPPVLRISKRGGRRSKTKRIKKKNQVSKFSIIGTNSAGLKAKVHSLWHAIKTLDFPSCITIQETKLRKKRNHQIDWISSF